jgi:uncharacterized cupin superfamily protein
VSAPELIAVDRGILDGPLEDWGPRAGADSGDPMTSGTIVQARGDGLPEVGVWECTPGGWPIQDRGDTETALLLSGRARLTNADGSSVELGPGEGVVLPRGWSGRWDILETVRKVYVVAE